MNEIRHMHPVGANWAALTLIGMSALSVACSSDSESPTPPPLGTPSAPSVASPAPTAAAPSNVPVSAAPPAQPAAPAANDANEGVDTDIELTPSASEVGAEAAAPSAAADAGAGDEPTATEPEPEPEPEPQPEPEQAGPLTVFLAGDSIVMTYRETASDRDQAGWGQMLGGFFDDQVTVNNRAIGGRTARRFIDEGRLDTLVDELGEGDFLLVQFGTNDGNRTATYTIGDQTIPYFLDPATDFKTYLQRYIDAAHSRGANPVLVTPTPRNSAYCTGGNGTAAHAAAMRELGQAENVPVVDLNAASVAYLREICPAPTPEDFFLLRADGTVDGTHFQERGARILAGFVADGLSVPGLPFAAHRLDP